MFSLLCWDCKLRPKSTQKKLTSSLLRFFLTSEEAANYKPGKLFKELLMCCKNFHELWNSDIFKYFQKWRLIFSEIFSIKTCETRVVRNIQIASMLWIQSASYHWSSLIFNTSTGHTVLCRVTKQWKIEAFFFLLSFENIYRSKKSVLISCHIVVIYLCAKFQVIWKCDFIDIIDMSLNIHTPKIIF